jgi:hypothetical protein
LDAAAYLEKSAGCRIHWLAQAPVRALAQAPVRALARAPSPGAAYAAGLPWQGMVRMGRGGRWRPDAGPARDRGQGQGQGQGLLRAQPAARGESVEASHKRMGRSP